MENLKLGNFIFEVAPRGQLNFTGGDRVLAVYAPPGGIPVYQDMGKEGEQIGWEGVLIGEKSRKDAEALEKLKDEALEVLFSFGEISHPVLIQKFEWRYRHALRSEYAIQLVRVEKEPEPEQAEQEQEEKDRLEEVMEAAQEKEPSRAMQLIRTAPYFIRQGDSLRSIATRFFRNPSYWRYLARLNGYQGDLLTLGLGALKIPVSATEMLLLKEVVNLIEKRMPVLATYDGGGRGRRKA